MIKKYINTVIKMALDLEKDLKSACRSALGKGCSL